MARPAPRFVWFIFRIVVAALLFTAVNKAASSQAVPTATGSGRFIAVGAGGAFFNSNYGQRWVGGYSIYADINRDVRFGAEFRAQSLRFNQEQGIRETSYLLGPRITYPHHAWIPYARVLLGAGIFKAPYNYAQGSYFVAAPGVGVDYVRGRVRYRIADIEYQAWPNFTFGQLHPWGYSTGISIRVR
jgi:hypothetical protein